MKELIALKEHYLQCRQEVQEAFSEAAQLEWVGQPITITITNVTTPIENSEGAECIICRYELTPPGVATVPCKHNYCRKCLEHWIHAAEKASHTCPYCRTELFPKPPYRVKEPEVANNYEKELFWIRLDLDRIHYSSQSATWFSQEVALQRSYERQTEASVASVGLPTTV
jgi:hypothetical protein